MLNHQNFKRIKAKNFLLVLVSEDEPSETIVDVVVLVSDDKAVVVVELASVVAIIC